MVESHESMRERWGPTAPTGFDPMARGEPGRVRRANVTTSSFLERIVSLELETASHVARFGRVNLRAGAETEGSE